MTIDINELRRLAQAATPGPWSVVEYNHAICVQTESASKSKYGASRYAAIGGFDRSDPAQLEEARANASIIAAANPAAINELLDRLEADERERDELRHCFYEWIDKTEWVQLGINEGTISPKYIGLHRADIIASLLGAAEKERDSARKLADSLALALNTSNHERDNLRAKIEAMERQEPVAWLHENRRDSDVVTNAVKHVWGKAAVGSMAAYSIPLYTLPGAKGEEK